MKRVKKRVDWNSFTEKLLHRYVLEKLYLDRDFFKKFFLRKRLKLVVPEDKSFYDKYQADFTMYLNGVSDGIPLEIKWKASGLRKKEQIANLRRRSGFLISFKADEEFDGIRNVEIDRANFKEWLRKRSGRLFDDAYNKKVGLSKKNKTWLVALRGEKAIKNYDKMRKHVGSKDYFWAFQNDRSAIENVLNLDIGDRMIFLFFRTDKVAGGQNLKRSSKGKIVVRRVYDVCVTDPYYMLPQDSFFEQKRNIPINKRKYVHYFDFKENKKPFLKGFSYPRKSLSKELNTKITDSANKKGILVELTSSEEHEFDGIINLYDQE